MSVIIAFWKNLLSFSSAVSDWVSLVGRAGKFNCAIPDPINSTVKMSHNIFLTAPPAVNYCKFIHAVKHVVICFSTRSFLTLEKLC